MLCEGKKEGESLFSSPLEHVACVAASRKFSDSSSNVCCSSRFLTLLAVASRNVVVAHDVGDVYGEWVCLREYMDS